MLNQQSFFATCSRQSITWIVLPGLEGSSHSRERGEPGLYRHAPMAFHRRGRGAHEIHFQQCSGRQVRYARSDRQGCGVCRLRRQQLHHRNGIVCGWRLRTGVGRSERRARHHQCFLRSALPCASSLELTGTTIPNERDFLMRQLQLVASGEPSEVIELHTVSEPVLGQEDALISMEAAPLNPSDFLLIRGIYGVRPAFPFSVGAEGVGRVTRTGSKVEVALQGKRVLILPTYEQGTWADQV